MLCVVCWVTQCGRDLARMGFVWLFDHYARNLLLLLLTSNELNALIVGLLAHSCRKIDRLSVRPSDLAKFGGCSGRTKGYHGFVRQNTKATTFLCAQDYSGACPGSLDSIVSLLGSRKLRILQRKLYNPIYRMLVTLIPPSRNATQLSSAATLPLLRLFSWPSP